MIIASNAYLGKPAIKLPYDEHRPYMAYVPPMGSMKPLHACITSEGRNQKQRRAQIRSKQPWENFRRRAGGHTYTAQ